MALTQVSTGGIKDDAVTDAKLPANSVGNSEMKDDAVGVAELSASGTAGNTTYLRGDNTWTVPPAGETNRMPLAGGTFTGDVIFDNATNAGKDIQWQPGSNRLAFFTDTKATFGNSVELQIWYDGTNSVLRNT